MLLYAKVGDIIRDQTRREEWWHVTLHLLTLPIQSVVWTLRSPQFTGQEIFTMKGEWRFIQAVQLDQTPPQPVADLNKNDGTGTANRSRGGLRIVK